MEVRVLSTAPSLRKAVAAIDVLLDAHLRRALIKPKTPEEQATAWRDSVNGLSDTKPLSDEPIRGESIYAEQGEARTASCE